MKLMEGRPRLHFLLVFAGMATAGMAVLHGLVFPSAAFERYLEANAVLATGLMRLFGFDASADGRFMLFESNVNTFERACDVSQTILVYLCAVLAFPYGRRRLLAALLGTAVIFAVNVLRAGTLLCIGLYWPAVFDPVHLYLWPVLLLLLAMGMWIAWALRSMEGEPA